MKKQIMSCFICSMLIVISYSGFSIAKQSYNKSHIIKNNIKITNIDKLNCHISNGKPELGDPYTSPPKGTKFCYGPIIKDSQEIVSIVSENSIISSNKKYHKKGFKLLKDLLNNKKIINYENYSSNDENFITHIGTLFIDSPDASMTMLGYINNIQYPGTDKVKAIYTLESQNPPAGDINVIVLAQKGNNYIMLLSGTGLKTNIGNSEKLSPLFSKCEKKYGYTNKAGICYGTALKSDLPSQKILRNKAIELVNKYQI